MTPLAGVWFVSTGVYAGNDSCDLLVVFGAIGGGAGTVRPLGLGAAGIGGVSREAGTGAAGLAAVLDFAGTALAAGAGGVCPGSLRGGGAK